MCDSRLNCPPSVAESSYLRNRNLACYVLPLFDLLKSAKKFKKNNMFDKAKNLYKLQKQAREIKEKLKNTHIEAENEGVSVIINGEQEVIEVRLTDETLQDKKKLETNLVNCMNKAVKKSQQIGAELMKDIMGDMNMPGLT
jgi:DNA-binding protein YbaB